ncbi:hypothetical protein C8F04DRAFT_1193088 [Mycena alexandri]|uniref:Uncharacterized protein n=1 Tax=Mycena alexandri TaxID=1745969 RepID=A0AAD6S9K0_9AGAR|nr:hypothetical protein C8F04DRAFT_1193088 [Mycena alexandri]
MASFNIFIQGIPRAISVTADTTIGWIKDYLERNKHISTTSAVYFTAGGRRAFILDTMESLRLGELSYLRVNLIVPGGATLADGPQASSSRNTRIHAANTTLRRSDDGDVEVAPSSDHRANLDDSKDGVFRATVQPILNHWKHKRPAFNPLREAESRTAYAILLQKLVQFSIRTARTQQTSRAEAESRPQDRDSPIWVNLATEEANTRNETGNDVDLSDQLVNVEMQYATDDDILEQGAEETPEVQEAGDGDNDDEDFELAPVEHDIDRIRVEC